MSTIKWALFSRLILIQALTIWVGSTAYAEDIKEEFKVLAKRSCSELKKHKGKLNFSAEKYCNAVKELREVSIVQSQLTQDGRSVDAKNWPSQMAVEIFDANWIKRSETSRLLLVTHEILGLALIPDLEYVNSIHALVQLGYILSVGNIESAMQQTQSNLSGVFASKTLKMWSRKKDQSTWSEKECRYRGISDRIENSPQFVVKIEHFAKKIRVLQSYGCITLGKDGEIDKDWIHHSDDTNPFFNLDNGKVKYMNYELGFIKNQTIHFENAKLLPDEMMSFEISGRTLKVLMLDRNQDEIVKVEATLQEDISVLPMLIESFRPMSDGLTEESK